MFYIAYLLDAKIHVVIPVTWVFNHEEIVQKFMRNAVNSNQKHLIYYNKETFNGIPDGRIDSNFTAPKRNDFPFIGEEACFIAKLTHYFSKIQYF